MAVAYPSLAAEAPSRTWQRFSKALCVTAGAVAAGCVIYAVEKYVLLPRRRFMESPAEVMMRAFGIAHFLLGWLFLAGSPRLRSGPALVRLGFWTLVGAGACLLYSGLGGAKQPLVSLAFYALFLIHEVRDEHNLARLSGDVPGDAGFGNALASATTWLLVTMLAGVHLLRGALLDRDSLADWPMGLLFAGWCVLAAGTVIAALRAWLSARARFGGINAALDAYAPLWHVYQALAAVLFLGSLLGSVGLNLVILIHVSVWLVFVPEQMTQVRDGRQAKAEADLSTPSRRRLWRWLRWTPTGFLACHFSLVAALLALMALRVHVWERTGVASQLLASSSFAYWSLLHICIAFARK